MIGKIYPRAAVSAIIVSEERILLVRRGCEPNKGLWSLPGGSIEPGETMREALAREVMEETSLTVEVGEVAAVHEVISRENEELRYHYVIVNLFARVTAGEPSAGSDAAEVRWVPLDSIAEYPTTEGLVQRLRAAGVWRRAED